MALPRLRASKDKTENGKLADTQLTTGKYLETPRMMMMMMAVVVLCSFIS